MAARYFGWPFFLIDLAETWKPPIQFWQHCSANGQRLPCDDEFTLTDGVYITEANDITFMDAYKLQFRQMGFHGLQAGTDGVDAVGRDHLA
jgi:hypothetical protein